MIMPDTMTSTYDDGGRIGRTDVVVVQRRRRWTPEEKVRIFLAWCNPRGIVALPADPRAAATFWQLSTT